MRLLLTKFISWGACTLLLAGCLPEGCQKDINNLSQFNLTIDLIPQNLRPSKPILPQVMKPDPWPGCTRLYALQLKGAKRYIFVDKNAQKNNHGTSWEDATPSIGSALKIAFDLRNSGDTKKIVLIIAGGEYSHAYEESMGLAADEPIIHMKESNIDILGGYEAHDPCLEIAENKKIKKDSAKDREVVLDGEDKTTVVKVVDINDITIKDLTIQNGNADDESGGGILIENSQNITLDGLLIRGSKAEDGGGVAVVGTSNNIAIKDSTIEHSQAKSGGGAYVDILGKIDFEQVRFKYNTASISGGGLKVRNNTSLVGLDQLLFEENSSVHGGGAYISGGRINFKGSKRPASRFIDNEASGNGGGLFVQDAREIDISFADFNENQAEVGGSIYVDGLEETFNLMRTKINKGIALRNAGGIYVNGGVGDGTKQLNMQRSPITNCVVSDAADGINGGSAGVYLANMNSLSLGEFIFSGNEVYNAKPDDYWAAALKFVNRKSLLPARNTSYDPSVEVDGSNLPFHPNGEFPFKLTGNINLLGNKVHVAGINVNNSNGISIPKAIHPDDDVTSPFNYFFRLIKDGVGAIVNTLSEPLNKPDKYNINWH